MHRIERNPPFLNKRNNVYFTIAPEWRITAHVDFRSRLEVRKDKVQSFPDAFRRAGGGPTRSLRCRWLFHLSEQRCAVTRAIRFCHSSQRVSLKNGCLLVLFNCLRFFPCGQKLIGRTFWIYLCDASVIIYPS